MATRYYALIAGIVFCLVGILGFVPNFVAMPVSAPDMNMSHNYGYLFGLFPVNGLHNIVHLAFGIWGLVAYTRYDRARSYSRVLAVSYAVLAVMGFIPGLNTVFGLIPLYGHDIWLHAVIAGSAAYFGYVRERGTSRIDTSRPVYHA